MAYLRVVGLVSDVAGDAHRNAGAGRVDHLGVPQPAQTAAQLDLVGIVMEVNEVAAAVLADTAFVFCTFHYEGAVEDQDEPFVADGRVTFILSRRTGSWKVIHYHESTGHVTGSGDADRASV
jgi:hypothetical protein